MKTNFSVAIALISGLFITACVTVPQETKANKNQLAISSVRDIPISYVQGSQFSLSPQYIKNTSLKAAETQAIYKIYSNAIVSDLTDNGFVNIASGNGADFYVGFEIALASDLSDKNISENFGIQPGLPSNNVFKKGSFLIYIEDGKSGKKVWRGAAQGFVHEDANETEREVRAAAIVTRVMNQFYVTN